MNAYSTAQNEADIFEILLPHLKKLCYKRWCNLDPEDCLSEASLFTLQAIRSLPLNSGHFISDLQETLVPYMDAKNRAAPSRYYGHPVSLDCQVATRSGTASWNYYDILADAGIDCTTIELASFLHSLPEHKRELVLDLIAGGMSKTAIAKKYGMTIYLMEKALKELWQNYQAEDWLEKQPHGIRATLTNTQKQYLSSDPTPDRRQWNG